MNLLNYKQDKVAVPDKEMLLVKDQYLYEINGLDMGKSVVLYKKELEIFKPMPKGDYKIIYQENNQYIQVTNEDIFKDYYAIQVVSITKLISSMYEPQGDIDVNIVLHELNNVITDMHGIVDYIKKVNFVVDSTKSTNVFPDLPIGSTVIRLEDGTLGAIPVSDIYEHFDRLTERIYNTVTGWLETDHQKFIQEMKEYKDELEKYLKELSDKLASDLQVLFNQKLEEFKQHIDNDLKPILLKYVNEVLKPELKSYVETLKAELNTYTTVTLFGKLDTKTIECINKIEAKCNECILKLNTHTENKKKELDAKTEKLKGDLNTHSEVKKQEISTHAIEVKSNLVDEITKEGTKQKTEVIETGDRVKEEINELIPDNLGIRVEQLENDRVLKAGDTITGTLNINMEGKDKVVLKSKGTTDGVVGSDTDGVIVENSKSGKSIRLDNDGVGIYPSTSLKTEAKDLSGAVNELLDNKLDKGTYSGNASDLNTEISKIASATQLGRIKVGDNLTINKDGILSGHPFPNYKGIYSEGTFYAIGDVVNVTGHEPCYVFETTLCEMSDPQHPKYFKKVYRIEDTMYYVKEKDGFEILFTKEEKIPFYTIPQKGEQQNYKSTVDDYFPYSDIRGVVFNGFVGTTIAQILDKNDATKQSNGSPSNLTSLGNVMNEYPKFYCQVKMTPQGRRYRIFSYKNPTKKIAMGIKPHPVFKKPDGSYKNFEYLSRYEGSHDGTRVVSLSGKSPYVNITQGTFRDKCRNGRNANWNMLTFEQISMLQCLYIVEFGDLNSQAVLGQGRANTSSASSTGTCNALGMRSGRISTDDANGNVCYRGYEDFYANIWDFIDGFMISNNGYHYTNDPSKFGNLSAMTLFPKTLNFKIPDGYVDKMEVIDGYEHLLIPYGTTGSTTTYYCDHFFSHNKGEENIALFGGAWLNGAVCGFFCLICHDGASVSGEAFGGRLSVFV